MQHGGMQTMFLKISDAIGPLPAMVFCAFASAKKTFYVPESYIPGHVLERLLGEDAFLSMIANFGGETIMAPSMRLDEVRNLGIVYTLTRRGLSAQEIESQTGLQYRNIKLLQQRIKSNRPLTELAAASLRPSGRVEIDG